MCLYLYIGNLHKEAFTCMSEDAYNVFICLQEDADGEAGISEPAHDGPRRSRRHRHHHHRHDRHGPRRVPSPDSKPPSQAATDSSDCSAPTTRHPSPPALPSAIDAPLESGSRAVENGSESANGHPLAGARQEAGDAQARGDQGAELLQGLSGVIHNRNGGAQQGDIGLASGSQGVGSGVSGTHTADAYEGFVDPFAQDAVQHAPLPREPSLAAELSQPIAIFSSEPSVQAGSLTHHKPTACISSYHRCSLFHTVQVTLFKFSGAKAQTKQSLLCLYDAAAAFHAH